MKLRVGLLTSVVVVLSHLTFGDGQRSDFTISITSIEHRERNTDRPYKVEAKTTGSSPTLYYTMSCKNGAAGLQVGHLYQVSEANDNGIKTLWISHRVERDPTIVALICDVESEKVAAKKAK
ncbi:MAG: hypothetical protein ACHQIK_21405 [Candidatus Acidiferrales bacterium]